MSRRLHKKRMKAAASKHINATIPAAAPQPVATETHVSVPAAEQEETFDFYIQYQNSQYDADEIVGRIYDKCEADGMDASGLKIYVKPEDRKAYYACTGGNSFIEL